MSDWRDHKNTMTVAERAKAASRDIDAARYAGDRSSVDVITELCHTCANAELERRRAAEEREARLLERIEALLVRNAALATERDDWQRKAMAMRKDRDEAITERAAAWGAMERDGAQCDRYRAALERIYKRLSGLFPDGFFTWEGAADNYWSEASPVDQFETDKEEADAAVIDLVEIAREALGGAK